MITPARLAFLEILKDSLENIKYDSDQEITLKQWQELYHLASIHDVIPLFTHTVYSSKPLQAYPEFKSIMITRAKSITLQQAKKSAGFIDLYQQMKENNLQPVVLKGILCRQLYPEPEQRPSSDEDLLISPEQINDYHRFFLSHEFNLVVPDIDLETSDEISYENKNTHLYIEVHKYLFPPQSSAFGPLNSLFDLTEKTWSTPIYGVPILSLTPTMHLLYMIAHAYKHFLYSGIGIRQICDICLFTKTYGSKIDWDRIHSSCKAVRIDLFMETIFYICEKYLGLDRSKQPYNELWKEPGNEKDLLNDILEGGLYGSANTDRLHSSNMTLEAVSAQKEKRKAKGLRKSLFPDLSYMKQKYTYLKKYAFLLPVAWIQRTFDYLFNKKKNSPVKTIQIGQDRISILRKYGIID